MTASIENETLLVNLIGIDQRNRNAIEMVFKREQSALCVITNAEEAALTIVDLDKYGAADEWEALQQIKPDQLAIFLSVDETCCDPSHFFLKKPVSINDLVTALDNARDKLSVSIFSNLRQQSSLRKLFTSRFKTIKNPVEQNTNIQDDDQKISRDSFRVNSKRVHFLSEYGYLIDEVKRAVVQANSEGHGIKIQINNQGCVFIDPTEHWINTDLVPAALEDLCQHSLNEYETVKRVFSDREFSIYLDEWRNTKLKPIDIDVFLWDLALWTYKGSLPANTDLEKKIILTYWPDLPRLTQVPNAMRIAALWVSCPMSLLETIEVLNVPEEDVYSFYSAVYTLGLISYDDQVVDNNEMDKSSRPLINSGKNQREFYLRILKHLKGQNSDD